MGNAFSSNPYGFRLPGPNTSFGEGDYGGNCVICDPHSRRFISVNRRYGRMLALLDEADRETLLPRFSDTLRYLTEWRDDGPRGGIHGRPAIEDMYETMYAPGKPWAAGKVEEPLAGVLSNRGGYTPEPQYAEHAAAEAGKPTTNPTNESGRKPKSMLTPFGYAEPCAEQQPANVLMISMCCRRTERPRQVRLQSRHRSSSFLNGQSPHNGMRHVCTVSDDY